MLLLADVTAWLAAAFVIYLVRTLIWGSIPLHWGLYLTGIGWLAFRAASGLYPPFGISEPEEMRRSFRTTATAAFTHLVILVGAGELDLYRTVGLMVWALVFPAAYFFRSFAKLWLIRSNRFGEPYFVVGAGPIGRQILGVMRRNRELGLLPVGVFSDFSELWGQRIEDVPVLGPVDLVTGYDAPYRVRHVIIALGNTPENRERTENLIAVLSKRYPSVQALAHLAETSNLLVKPRAVGPYLALEIRQPRLNPRQRIVKRAVDLAIAVPTFFVAVPIIATAALAVKIASPGPAFFAQVREGQHGKPIRIWKLRTMVTNAEKRLAEYLAANPAARFEYERTLKLRSDPRVIRGVGHFLRRSSIDELPQLLSVLRGDLTLVGPRVMLAHEVARFSERGRELRRDVRPGLTGLWQILYRNNSDLQIWEATDSYYVNNWSIWMDVWILFRTVRVVVTGAGAF